MDDKPALRLDHIRRRRIELKMTQAYMAGQLGFKNASTYMKYERGEYAFKAAHLPVIAALLGYRIAELYADQDQDESSDGAP